MNPGSAYEGNCPNCGRTIRAVLFFDWEGIHHPSVIWGGCGCQAGDANCELARVPGSVTTAAMRSGAIQEQPS